MSQRRAYVQTFGCRAAQSDGAGIEAQLREAGFEILRSAKHADLVVVNACTVTHAADIDARRVIRNSHRDRPEAQIVVTGCYAQRAPTEIAELAGVTAVIGNSDKHRLAELVADTAHEEFHGRVIHAPFSKDAAFTAAPVWDTREDRARPNLKIQDGCNNRCSFCIIPAVRGPNRSASVDAIIEQVRVLTARYPEIVLTGINLGRWGRDLPERTRFPALLRRLLDETEVRRLRLSSVEPMDWSDELLNLMASEERLAPHVHMPLQSGSDSVLKRMRRRYRTRHYADRMHFAYQLMSDAAFGADVMTGYPGETEEEFSETVDFIRAMPFTYLHVFTYSERPGTPAAKVDASVPAAVRRERTQALRKISSEKNLLFRQQMLGRLLPAVTLEKPGMALSSNYLTVQMAEVRAPQQLVTLKVGGLSESGLREQTWFPMLPGSGQQVVVKSGQKQE